MRFLRRGHRAPAEILGEPRLPSAEGAPAEATLAGIRRWIEDSLRDTRQLRAERTELQGNLTAQRRRILTDLLKVADALDNHLEHAARRKDELNDRGRRLLSAMEAVRRLLADVLRKSGVDPIDCTGVANPDLCTVVDTEPRHDVPEGTIVEVLLRGYLLDGEILRHPEVKVASPR